MVKQMGYRVAALLAMGFIFMSCGEDELLTELQGEVGDLQNEINLLSVKADSAGKENDRLMADIVNGIMKVHDYSETKKDDYGGEKSYVMAAMIPTSMAQYCIQ